MRGLRHQSAEPVEHSSSLQLRKYSVITPENDIIQREKDIGSRKIFDKKFDPSIDNYDSADRGQLLQKFFIVFPLKRQVNRK